MQITLEGKNPQKIAVVHFEMDETTASWTDREGVKTSVPVASIKRLTLKRHKGRLL